MDSPARPFASGSRQAPDPFDQYLEREGYYRKHVARDATCLFRTFSEQIFDVQLYHAKVRQDCVRWMRMKSDEYKKKIIGDFDDYLIEISKPRSYGSFVELNALAHAYRRNVLLFEPYNVGTWFVKEDTYSKTVKVFFSPDKHFDSIFSTTYIQQAAYCQALVYEILYVNVFKLPDVMYSVERMLHDPEGKIIKAWDETDPTVDRIATLEGMTFVFDIAEKTECVLDNYLLCHFHNKDNFDTVVDSYRNKKHASDFRENHYVRSSGNRGLLTRELINPMLCDKRISCVRQLLKEGITPFPYKVAKALDPNIYRNIEFDSWSELRRELKYRKWCFEQSRLQVGAKCMVRLRDSDEHFSYGYIQEMNPGNGPCLVYVEDLAECRTVPYERLHPIPIDQTRYYKFRRSSSAQQAKLSCSNHSKNKTGSFDADITKIKVSDNEIYQYYMPYYDAEKSYCCTIKKFTNTNHFQAAHVEMVMMPFTVEGNKQNSNKNRNEPIDSIDQSNIINEQTEVDTTVHSSSGVYDISGSSNMSHDNQSYCYAYPEQFPYNPVTSSALCALPYSTQQVTIASQGPYPGMIYGSPYQFTAPYSDIFSSYRASSDEVPNFQAAISIAHNGSDLPLNDLTTLRYFYNLGVEYFRNNQFRLEPPTAISTHVNSNINDDNGMKELVDELNSGMNLNASNVPDGHIKQRGGFTGENTQNTKRKYSTKFLRKQTDNRGKQRTCMPASTATKEIKHIESTTTAEHAYYDISQPLPYNQTPVMPPTQQYPVRVPYYTVADPSFCMIPSYGHSFLAAPPDIMLFPENPQPPSLHNPHEAQYHPVMLTSSQVGAGFTIMGLPQTTALNTLQNNAENKNNDIEQ